jgi:hypothetical protein
MGRRWPVRVVTLLVLTTMLVLGWTAGAWAAPPVINSIRYTNQIAYDLRSLQSTRFIANVDHDSTPATLTVKTMRGDVVVWHGRIPAADTNFFVPLWNGMGPDGRKLPPAVYDWEFKIGYQGEGTNAAIRPMLAGGGESWVAARSSGKIIVSNVCFNVSGMALGSSEPRYHDAWMKPGNANMYVVLDALVDPSPVDSFDLQLWGPVAGTYNVEKAWTGLAMGTRKTDTFYLRPPKEIKTRGIHTFQCAAGYQVRYNITVIQ